MIILEELTLKQHQIDHRPIQLTEKQETIETTSYNPNPFTKFNKNNDHPSPTQQTQKNQPAFVQIHPRPRGILKKLLNAIQHTFS